MSVLDARCYVCGHTISGPVTIYTDRGSAHPTCVNCSPHAEARIAELEAENARKDAELAAVKVSNNKWLAKWERAETQLAEARKALEQIEQQLDYGQNDKAHSIAVEAVRRARTGGKKDG